MSLKSLLLLPVGLLSVAACSPTSPTKGVPLGSEFTLKPGQTAQIDGTDLGVIFQGVVSDSRCPADAICVQAGDAVLALHVGTADIQLRSNSAPERAVGIYRVRVTRVEPYPLSSRTIAPGDYLGAFIVTR